MAWVALGWAVVAARVVVAEMSRRSTVRPLQVGRWRNTAYIRLAAEWYRRNSCSTASRQYFPSGLRTSCSHTRSSPSRRRAAARPAAAAETAALVTPGHCRSNNDTSLGSCLQ